MGGHSNQLFQYAFGRQLAEKHQTNLYLDLSWFDQIDKGDTKRDYELGVYPLKATIIDTSLLNVVESERASAKDKLLRLSGRDKRIWTVAQRGNSFSKSYLRTPDNSLLIGYWQNEKFFPHVTKQIRQELEPKEAPSKDDRHLIDLMRSSESIWIHVRRGDYLTNPNANKFHGVKDKAYFTSAFNKLESILGDEAKKNIQVFICSNDIDWCKNNLKFEYPTHYFSNKLGSEDMRMAKHCKHDILSNSSFSWWGAWLNNNPNKIVIAPKKWFADDKANRESNIVPKSWIRI